MQFKTKIINALASLNRRFYFLPLTFWRWLYFPEIRSALGFQALIADYGGNLKLQIDTNSFIEWSIWCSGFFEFEIAMILKQKLRKGDVCVDVGANIGDNTLLARKFVGVSGQVVAFEPNPAIFKRLKGNLALNGFHDVRVKENALSVEEKLEKFYLSEKKDFNQGVSSFSQNHTKTQATLILKTTTLDKAFTEANLAKLDFLLIDTEGHDLKVLRGGLETISNYLPNIIFEFENASGKSSSQENQGVLASLAELGYEFYLIPVIPFLHKFSLKLFGVNRLNWLKPIGITEILNLNFGNILASTGAVQK